MYILSLDAGSSTEDKDSNDDDDDGICYINIILISCYIIFLLFVILLYKMFIISLECSFAIPNTFWDFL